MLEMLHYLSSSILGIWIYLAHFDPHWLISCCVVCLSLCRDPAMYGPSFPSPLKMAGSLALFLSLLYDQINLTAAKAQKNTGLKFPFRCVFRSPAARRCLSLECSAAAESPVLWGEVGQHSTEINCFHWQAWVLSPSDNCIVGKNG